VAEKLIYHNKHSNEKNIAKGDEWYETLAFRAINQALGRCIRHRLDWGSIVLLDARFYKEKYLKQLPKWFQRFIQPADTFAIAEKSLSEFLEMQKKKAAAVAETVLASETSTVFMENSENDPHSTGPLVENNWKCVGCSQLLATSSVCILFPTPVMNWSSEVFIVGQVREFTGSECSKIEACLQTGLINDRMCTYYSCVNCNETLGFCYDQQLAFFAEKATFSQ
jgi:hypothetical protein